MASIRRTMIAMLALALTTSACGRGGVPPEELSFEFFQDARPVYKKSAGRPVLLAPAKGSDPEGDANAARGMQREMGPSMQVRLASIEGGPSITVGSQELDPQDFGEIDVSEQFRSEDVNGHSAIILTFAGETMIGWRTATMMLSVSGTGSIDPMLEVARGIRERGPDPRRIQIKVIPDGYEFADKSKSEGGTVDMAGLMFGSEQERDMLMIMSTYSDTVDATEMPTLSGQDRPSGMRQVTVRGADALIFSFSLPIPEGFNATFLMWRERPDVMGMMMGVGRSASEDRVLAMAESIREISKAEWDARYWQDETMFNSFGG